MTRNLPLSRRGRALSIHTATHEEGNRIDQSTMPCVPFQDANSRLSRMNHSAPGPNRVLSTPSGIAQLRKASDYSVLPTVTTNNSHDPMNLDDFIIPTSIGTPAGLSPSPSAEKMAHSANTVASAIPIRRQSQIHDDHLSRASAPVVPPNTRREPEFGYVQRHVRKTSIDERSQKVWPVHSQRPCCDYLY